MNIDQLQRFCRACAALLAAVMLCLLSAGRLQSAHAQGLNSEDRSRGHLMLDALKDDVKKNYYDANFHGIDLEAHFKKAHEFIKGAKTLGDVFGIIAQTMMAFNDSHTFFIPPEQTTKSEYGWRWKAIGDKCYVVALQPGSPAEKAGLKVGDRVLTIDGVLAKREDLWKLSYLYYGLRPAPGLRLYIASPGETKARMLDVPAKVTQEKRTLDFTGTNGGTDIWKSIWSSEREERANRHRGLVMGDAFIWKMPEFNMPDGVVDEWVGKAKGHKALILDLRGNGGGSVETLARLLGNVLDHDVKIGDLKGRKEMKPQMAKTRGKNVFTGKLVVLIDSNSGSAAELFARVVQMEKRGTVIGDRSAGAVMRAQHFSHDIGMDIKIFFASSVTDADVIMTDGKSLENAGVTPDELLLPTAEDLAANRDPVLAHAAELAGVELSAEKAGTLFPYEWVK
jgi:C-terminal processing protease CtpA/Prc